MQTPRTVIGSPPLLFERLADSSRKPVGTRTSGVLDKDALRNSVKRELGRLLNTRCPIPIGRFPVEGRTAIDYGVPDFSSLSPRSTDDRNRIESILSHAVRTFEPRLRQVQVSVVEPLASERALSVKIDALLTVDSITERVSFPVLINSSDGMTEIYEGQ
ncbi:MAG TPA: type VI secretion system baseplate subunit TssE [Blastocatellia bacterium]|nr:type VI secretion system baseplate subunit TssE [Blastocatellia bacterium]